jgi:hypothetical protein
MDIHLKDSDISQMPDPLRRELLQWIPGHLAKKPQQSASTSQPNRKFQAHQLSLNFHGGDKPDHSHVLLSELMDAGFTKPGMPVRVRLKRDLAKELGREYINGLEISAKGTIFYDQAEFDKPSPLAKIVNKGEVNGWVYVQVKKNGEWIDLDKLRKNWRKTNG